VVAHSHGGNVALYALRDPAVRSLIAGLVCLGTPFIEVQRRALGPTLTLLKTITNIVFWYAMVVLAAWLAILIADLWHEPWVWAVTVASIALASVYPGLRVRLFERVATRLEAAQNRMLSRLLPARAASLPMLVIKARSDEASLGLRLADALSDLPFKLWSPRALLVIAFVVLVVTMPLFLAMGMVVVSPAVTERMRSTLDDTVFALTIGTGSIALMMLALGLVTILAQTLLPLWSALLRNHRLTFGDRTPAENWLLHISALPDPPEATCVTTSTFAVSGKGLRHSQLHTDPRCIDAIADWTKHCAQDGHAAHEAGQTPQEAGLERTDQQIASVAANHHRMGLLVFTLGILALCVPVVVTGLFTVYAICPACPLPSLVKYSAYGLDLFGLLPSVEDFPSWEFFAWIGAEALPGVALVWWGWRLSSPASAEEAALQNQ